MRGRSSSATGSGACARPPAWGDAARATGAYDRKLAALGRVPLLIIDDFELKPLRAPADEDLHDLIAERYERAATIVTSNLDFDELERGLRRQPPARLGHHRPAAPQRLLPRTRRPVIPRSAGAASVQKDDPKTNRQRCKIAPSKECFEHALRHHAYWPEYADSG